MYQQPASRNLDLVLIKAIGEANGPSGVTARDF